jgi:hypothetical protein
VKDELGGRRVKCKSCGGAMSVPAAAMAAAADDVLLEPVVDQTIPLQASPARPQLAGANAPAFAHANAAHPGSMLPPPGVMQPQQTYAAPADTGAVVGRAAMGIVAGLIASLVCAVVWGLVAHFTGYELGILAIGMGAVIGGAMCATTPNRTAVLGVAAVVFVVMGLHLGKTFAVASALMTDPEYADMPFIGVIIGSPIGAFFAYGLFDILWLGLGGYTAWKQCTTADGEA